MNKLFDETGATQTERIADSASRSVREPSIGAIPASLAETAALEADALVSLACPHCGHDNFAASQYCDRCQRPLATKARTPLLSSPLERYDRSEEPLARAARGELEPTDVIPAKAGIQFAVDLDSGSRRNDGSGKQATATFASYPPPHLLRVGTALAVDTGIVAALGAGLLLTAMRLTGAGVRGVGLASLAAWIHARPHVSAAVLLATIAAAVAYGAVSARWRSAGGLLVGVRLISTDGTRPSWPRALTRALLAVISAAPFGAGVWWRLAQRNARTWHDLLAGTRPIRSSEY